MCTSLGDFPSSEDVDVALQQLKNGKAPGKSRILHCTRDVESWEGKLRLCGNAYRSCPSNMEGESGATGLAGCHSCNLHCCDNWRGIALLDVVGKMLGRIVQNHLQKLGEEVLPESRCGFRKGRSCTDMIFMVCQLAEKATEHDTVQYFIFVDL